MKSGWEEGPQLKAACSCTENTKEMSSLNPLQEAGVRVSILLYKELAAVLGINSLHSKKMMLQHPNIKVIR